MICGENYVTGRANEPYQKKIIIDKLMDLWEKNPHLRLGQLISNFYNPDVLYNVEDWDLIQHLEAAYADLAAREGH